MVRSVFWLAGLSGFFAVAAAIGACSAGGEASGSEFTSGDGNTRGAGNGSSTGNGGDGAGAAGQGGSTFHPSGGGSTSTGNTTCNHDPAEDGDGDGWTGAQGDCNDCDANVNPGALEVIAVADADGGLPEPADENCDMQVDNVAAPCDQALAMADQNAMSGAQAIGLCQLASADGTKGQPGYSAGVISATYVLANGGPLATPAQSVGILPSFGPNVNPQEGTKVLALSSGYARAAGDPGECAGYSCSTRGPNTPPAGFPAPVAGCQGGPGTQINDDVGLELQLRAPTNATGYRFNFKFYSFEFPEFVCSQFNDQFVALVNPPPSGAQNGNISFDSGNNPVSINIAFFDVCDPATASQWAQSCGGCTPPPLPNPYCPSGTTELVGTGYLQKSGNYGGGTSWLQTQAPIGPGEEFTIRFATWDTQDHGWDSIVLVDNFAWIAGAGTTVEVVTDPVKDPL
jgi:hypothetical protein